MYYTIYTYKLERYQDQGTERRGWPALKAAQADSGFAKWTPSWPGIAVRRMASLPLAYVPAIHDFDAEILA
jgi:hypothetical protein